MKVISPERANEDINERRTFVDAETVKMREGIYIHKNHYKSYMEDVVPYRYISIESAESADNTLMHFSLSDGIISILDWADFEIDMFYPTGESLIMAVKQ